MSNNITHLLRYGTHSEKDFFLKPTYKDKYDIAVLNSNIVAYTPKTMSAFMLKLKKPFIIDPQTHAFQHDFEKLRSKGGKPKRSLSKLAEEYGGVIKDTFDSESSLDLTNLNDGDKKNDLVENVIKFQNETFINAVKEGPESDYVDYALKAKSDTLDEKHLRPDHIVAPYFYYQSNSAEMFDLNTDLINKTINKKPENSLVAAQIVFDKRLICDKNFIDEIVNKYNSLSVDCYLLWIDNFDETSVSNEELKGFVRLVKGLYHSDKKIFNLYGGYFSIMLAKITDGLSGVCHGMEYGESRQVVPVGGGLPRVKYYFPPLHNRFNIEVVARLLEKKKSWLKSSNVPKDICACESCEKFEKFADTTTYEYETKTGKRQGEFPTQEAKKHSLHHYLYNKKNEYDFVVKNEIEKILSDLDKSIKEYDGDGDIDVEYLSNWKTVLSKER